MQRKRIKLRQLNNFVNICQVTSRKTNTKKLHTSFFRNNRNVNKYKRKEKLIIFDDFTLVLLLFFVLGKQVFHLYDKNYILLIIISFSHSEAVTNIGIVILFRIKPNKIIMTFKIFLFFFITILKESDRR